MSGKGYTVHLAFAVYCDEKDIGGGIGEEDVRCRRGLRCRLEDCGGHGWDVSVAKAINCD